MLTMMHKQSGCTLALALMLLGCAPTGVESVSEQVVTVAKSQVDCVGVGPRTCLVVDGELFYDDIEGFTHVDGIAYKLRIERRQVYTAENAPADASLYRYTLISILNQTPA